MSKEVNTRKLVIGKSTFEIDKSLDYKDYTIALYVSVHDISRPDNQDGTVDVVFKAKATGEMIIKDEFDKVYIKADKSKQSQKMNSQIRLEGRDYDSDMTAMRHLYNPYIIDLIDKFKNGEIE